MRDLGREDDYSWDRPAAAPIRIDITSYRAVKHILEHPKEFNVVWNDGFEWLMGKEGPKFMLSGDTSFRKFSSAISMLQNDMAGLLALCLVIRLAIQPKLLALLFDVSRIDDEFARYPTKEADGCKPISVSCYHVLGHETPGTSTKASPMKFSKSRRLITNTRQ